jgi:vancomycin resistance protein YoaR
MCEAVDGLVLHPGETLSINELVGQRTEAKGYMPAPAIMDGTMLVDDIGGGICQLAGTLYNAVLLADVEVVERVRHSFPSDYLPIGQDSTLNWNNKDLKFKNRSEWPLYLSARLEDNACTVEVYGAYPKGSGYRIEVVNDIVQTMKPGEQTTRYTDSLPPGQTEVLVKARTGYDVYVYRNYYLGDKLVENEQLSHDVYPAITGVVNIGSGVMPPDLPPDFLTAGNYPDATGEVPADSVGAPF